MAERGDITFTYGLSPRIITVDSPSTEITLQDLVDTIRGSEEEEINLEDTSLLDGQNTAGKQDLGGSVEVGITATLFDTVISFEARKVWASAGTVTTGDATGRNLIDSGATFISDGVAPGSWIVNFTDLSLCSVLKVISETELRTDILGAGSDNQFDSADVYRVMNVIQCEVNGGNAVAIDKTGVTISSILPTAGTQVIRTSASSATNSNSLTSEFASFNSGVTVDIGNLTGLAGSGTTFPAGTIRQPCNDFADALLIAGERGFNTFFIKGNATIDAGLDYDDFSFIGDSVSRSSLFITASASVLACEFKNATISGTLDGYSSIKDCVVNDIDFFNGVISNCGLGGTITLSGGEQGEVIDCHSEIAGSDTPTIDMGISGQSLIIRGYDGGIKLINKTGTDDVSIDISSGQVILDSTVTVNGEIIIRGIGKLTNNSVPGIGTVDSVDLISGEDLTILGEATKRRVESLRPQHHGSGLDCYVDPTNGDDLNDGLVPTRALKTFAEAHTRVVSGRGDVIWLLNLTAAKETLTEFINITKNRVLVRGPGLNFTVKAPNDTANLIEITGGGVAIEGIRLEGTGATVRHGINHSGPDHLQVINVQFESITGDCIVSAGGDAHVFNNLLINEPGGNGLTLTDTTHGMIIDSKIDTVGAVGVEVLSTGPSVAHSLEIQNTHIHLAGTIGVSIGTNVEGTVIRQDSIIHGPNTAVIDNGTATSNASVTPTSVSNLTRNKLIPFLDV